MATPVSCEPGIRDLFAAARNVFRVPICNLRRPSSKQGIQMADIPKAIRPIRREPDDGERGKGTGEGPDRRSLEPMTYALRGGLESSTGVQMVTSALLV